MKWNKYSKGLICLLDVYFSYLKFLHLNGSQFYALTKLNVTGSNIIAVFMLLVRYKGRVYLFYNKPNYHFKIVAQ